MATKDTKYNLKFSGQIYIEKILDDGSVAPFSNLEAAQEYKNLDYVQITAVQQTMVNLGQQLADFGWAGSDALGFVETPVVEEMAKKGRGKKA